MTRKGYTVSQVAKLAHVTVRTLHHYDELGLLVPSDRTHVGYRLYSDSDLARLREILLLRELGFALDAIAELLEQPAATRVGALRSQRQRLLAERLELDAVIRALDRTLDSLEGDTPMSTENMFEGFDQFAEEAEQRWGNTPAYQESQRRTRSYRKEDWAAIQAEAGEIIEGLVAVLERGLSADSGEAMDLADRYRLHIDRWFYPCDHAMHRVLGEMYVADPRFESFYEQRRAGLARFVSEAIVANAARHGA